jgi:hypothetical protein
VDPRPLTYASGRVQITREGESLVVDFPPTESALEFWLAMSITMGTALLCLLGVIWPGEISWTANGLVAEPGPVSVRVMSLVIAVGLATLCWSWFRNRHAHSVLSLRDRSLQYSHAGLRRVVTRDYDLSKYVDVGLERDDHGTHLAFLRGDGSATVLSVGAFASRQGEVELAAVADAIRRAAWPRRAAEHPRSTFTRVDADTVESDRGFTVRTPAVGVVEYREGRKTITLRVERAWSADHAMCFVLPPDALRQWDGAPEGSEVSPEIPPEKRRDIEYNLTETLTHLGVRLLINSPATRTTSPRSPS